MAYHHGDLRAALIDAGLRLLGRDGLAGLTLRAVAREVGVSSAAPKNHFGNVEGLVSELAAEGYRRLGRRMSAARRGGLAALGRAYVEFALANPGLYLLMFRGERLDMGRPALREAASSLTDLLAAAAGGVEPGSPLTAEQGAAMALAWGEVHGLASLLIDDRLRPIVARLAPGVSEAELLARILA